MQLYFAPGACSLAGHIALREAGLAFDLARVDLKTHRTQTGQDYLQINPKGYVPALVLDDGETLTENIAVLTWIGDHGGLAGPAAALGRYRLLEMLAYISTELHKSFKPFFTPGAEAAAKDQASRTIAQRLDYLDERLSADFLFGAAPTVADCYLYVMLRWAQGVGVNAPARLAGLRDRMTERPATQTALQQEEAAKA
jgi:glutathione S-transferase